MKKKCFFELHHHRSILLGWLVGWQLREKEFLENLLETSYDWVVGANFRKILNSVLIHHN